MNLTVFKAKNVDASKGLTESCQFDLSILFRLRKSRLYGEGSLQYLLDMVGSKNIITGKTVAN